MTAGLRGPSRRRPCRALCARNSPRDASVPLPINAVVHRDYFLDGTGFDKVAEDYRYADEAHRPFIASLSDYFTLVLPDLTYINGVASSDPPALLFVPVPNGGTYDEAILSACYATSCTAKDIAQAIGLSDSSYFRKRIRFRVVGDKTVALEPATKVHLQLVHGPAPV